MTPTRRTFQKGLSCSREMFVPFGKVICLQNPFLDNPVWMVLSERKSKGARERGAVADPRGGAIAGRVSG